MIWWRIGCSAETMLPAGAPEELPAELPYHFGKSFAVTGGYESASRLAEKSINMKFESSLS